MSTVVFKYCNFVLLLVNRVVLLDLLQVKTTGKFNIYLPINKGKFKIILLITGFKGVVKVWGPEISQGYYYMNMTPPATFIGINKEDRMKRTS